MMAAVKKRGTLAILGTFIVALLLTVWPLPDWAQAFRPQWYALVLIYWASAIPDRVNIGYAWLLGIVVDLLTGSLFGQHALSLSLVAYVVNKLHLRARVFPLWQQSIGALFLLILERLVVIWVNGAIGQPTPGLEHWSPPLLGMLLWPWVFILLRDLRRRNHIA